MKKPKRRLPVCGPCTECCTHIKVEALDKPAGVACKHLCSKGCGIYSQRPSECKAYVCGWLEGYAPRPDACGIIFERCSIFVGHEITLFIAIPCRQGALEEEANMRLMASLCKAGESVVFTMSGAMFAADEQDAEDVENWFDERRAAGGVNFLGSDGKTTRINL